MVYTKELTAQEASQVQPLPTVRLRYCWHSWEVTIDMMIPVPTNSVCKSSSGRAGGGGGWGQGSEGQAPAQP